MFFSVQKSGRRKKWHAAPELTGGCYRIYLPIAGPVYIQGSRQLVGNCRGCLNLAFLASYSEEQMPPSCFHAPSSSTTPLPHPSSGGLSRNHLSTYSDIPTSVCSHIYTCGDLIGLSAATCIGRGSIFEPHMGEHHGSACESEKPVEDDAMSSFGLVQRLADASRHNIGSFD